MISMRKENLPKVSAEPGAWMEKMRDALFDGVTEADMTAIMKKQVEKAKSGDAAATKLIMDLVVAKSPTKQVLNVYEAPQASDPTDAPQGSIRKVRRLADRAARGESLFHPADGAVDENVPRRQPDRD